MGSWVIWNSHNWLCESRKRRLSCCIKMIWCVEERLAWEYVHLNNVKNLLKKSFTLSKLPFWANWALCCFQTSLLHAALLLWWWYLYNCASATCLGGKCKWKAVLSQSIDNPRFCSMLQMAGIWLLFDFGAMPLGEKAKAAWLLRAVTLKWEAMITWHSGNAASYSETALA